VGIAETSAAQLRVFAAGFGLTPVAERRISVVSTGGDPGDSPYGVS
jgi:phage terminase small subunit